MLLCLHCFAAWFMQSCQYKEDETYSEKSDIHTGVVENLKKWGAQNVPRLLPLAI